MFSQFRKSVRFVWKRWMELVYREIIELGLNTEDATEDIHRRRLRHALYSEL